MESKPNQIWKAKEIKITSIPGNQQQAEDADHTISDEVILPEDDIADIEDPETEDLDDIDLDEEILDLSEQDEDDEEDDKTDPSSPNTRTDSL